MATYTPIQSSETLDRSNWYYIPGDTQDDTNTNYQPRNPFSSVDGVTENIITFWNSGSTTEKMLSYKNAISGTATLTFKILRGGGGSTQPTYNIKIATGVTNRVFHLGTYDWVTNAQVQVVKSSTGYTKTDTWISEQTITRTDIEFSAWTEITQTITGENFYIGIKQPTADNGGGFALADVELTITNTTGDRSTEVLRGIITPYPHESVNAIWDSEKNFSQQSPRAGTPLPSKETGLVLLTTGAQDETTDITITTERAGSVNLETGKNASFTWNETDDSHVYGFDYPTTIQGYHNLGVKSLLQNFTTPDSIRISDDESLIIVYYDSIGRNVRYIKLQKNGTQTTTTLTTFGAAPTVSPNPCICQLPNGHILIAHYSSFSNTSKCQIRTYISRDNGSTFELASTNALDESIDINSSTGVSLKRLRMLSNENQVLIIGHVEQNPTGYNKIIQFASSNMGSSFRNLGIQTLDFQVGFIGMFLNKNNQFRIMFLKGVDGDEFGLLTLPHAFFTVATATSLQDQFVITSGDIFYLNPSTNEIEKGLEADVYQDEDEKIYVIFRHVEATDEGSFFMRVSLDDGESWFFVNGADSLTDSKYLYRSEEVSSTLKQIRGVPFQGKHALIITNKSNTSGNSDSLSLLYLGGYSTRTLPATSELETPIYESMGFYRTWLPFDTPDNTGLFVSSGTTSQASVTPEYMTISGSSFLYYKKDVSTTPDEGYLIRTSLEPISGGSDSSLQRGIRLRLKDSTTSYEVELRISTNKIVVFDPIANSSLGDLTFGTGTAHIDLLISMYRAKIYVWIAYHNRVNGSFSSKKYELVNDISSTLQDDGTSSTEPSTIQFGHFTNWTGETRFYEFHRTTSSQVDQNLTPSTDILSREYPKFGEYVYIDGGMRITTKDSPTYKGDSWRIEQTALYPIEKIFFSESPSMSVYWRSLSVTSGNVPNNFIPLLLDNNFTTGANFSMGNDIIGFRLEGINFRNINLKYRNGTTNTWITLSSIDVSSGLSGSFTRQGANIQPIGASANPDPFFGQYCEFKGAIAELDNGAGTIVRRRIAWNSSGTFSNVSSQRLQIKLEDASPSDPTSGTLRIIPNSITIVVSVNGVRAIAWGLDIPAQETIDNFFQISNFCFGPISIFSPQYGRGRSISFEPNVEIFETPDGTIKPRKRGEGRRTCRIAWSEGVDTRSIYGDLTQLEYYKSSDTSGAEAVSTWGDIPHKLEGVYRYCSGVKPIVYLPYVVYAETSSNDIRILNRREQHIFGLLDGGMSFDNVLGDEYSDEVFRVASITIKEII